MSFEDIAKTAIIMRFTLVDEEDIVGIFNGLKISQVIVVMIYQTVFKFAKDSNYKFFYGRRFITIIIINRPKRQYIHKHTKKLVKKKHIIRNALR